MKLPNLFTPGNFSFPLYGKKRDLLKVLFISHTGNLGGAERSLLDLIDQFKERGISCKVIIPDEGLIERELKDLSVGYKIIPFEWWAQVEKESVKKLAQAALKNNNAILEIANEIKEYNPDIVYSNTIVIPWGAIAAHLTGKIHIWHIREFGVKDHGLNFNLGYAQSLKIIDQLSDAVFVNSKAVKKEISKVIKKSKIFQFYNYIAPKFEGSDTRIQNPDAFKLLLLGTITHPKARKRIARNSQKTVRQNFNRKKSINSLLKTMLDLKNLENKPTHLSYYIN